MGHWGRRKNAWSGVSLWFWRKRTWTHRVPQILYRGCSWARVPRHTNHRNCHGEADKNAFVTCSDEKRQTDFRPWTKYYASFPDPGWNWVFWWTRTIVNTCRQRVNRVCASYTEKKHKTQSTWHSIMKNLILRFDVHNKPSMSPNSAKKKFKRPEMLNTRLFSRVRQRRTTKLKSSRTQNAHYINKALRGADTVSRWKKEKEEDSNQTAVVCLLCGGDCDLDVYALCRREKLHSALEKMAKWMSDSPRNCLE